MNRINAIDEELAALRSDTSTDHSSEIKSLETERAVRMGIYEKSLKLADIAHDSAILQAWENERGERIRQEEEKHLAAIASIEAEYP